MPTSVSATPTIGSLPATAWHVCLSPLPLPTKLPMWTQKQMKQKAWYGKFNLDFLIRAGIVYNTGKLLRRYFFCWKNYNYHRNSFSVDNGFGTLQIYAGFNFNTRKEYRKKK